MTGLYVMIIAVILIKCYGGPTAAVVILKGYYLLTIKHWKEHRGLPPKLVNQTLRPTVISVSAGLRLFI